MTQRPERKYREEVLAAIGELLASRPEASPRAMFGHPGFAVGGKMFATLYDAGLAVKLPPEQVQEALMLPGVELFRPYGKAMREWVYIVHDDPEAYAGDLDLLDAAMDYVASLAGDPSSGRSRHTQRASRP
ncbi:MAG: TfoX/Sxy family protein [Chloroflexota bacterium]